MSGHNPSPVSNISLLDSTIAFSYVDYQYVGLFRSDRTVGVYKTKRNNENIDPFGTAQKTTYIHALQELSADLQVVAIFVNDIENILTIVFKSEESLKYCLTSGKVLDKTVSNCVIKIFKIL